MALRSRSRSRSRSRDREVRNLAARVMTEWAGDEARPLEKVWVAQVHRDGIASLKRPECYGLLRKLLIALPRNPHRKLYEQTTCLSEQLRVIKYLVRDA